MCAGAVRTTATSTATKAARITPTSRYFAPIVLVRIRILPIEVQRLLVDDDPPPQDHDEATALPAPRRVAHLAPMPPRNRPPQGVPQPGTRDFLDSHTAGEPAQQTPPLCLGRALPRARSG